MTTRALGCYCRVIMTGTALYATRAVIVRVLAVHPRLTLFVRVAVMAYRWPIAIAAAGRVAIGAYRSLIRRKAVMRGRSMRPARIRRFAACGIIKMTVRAFSRHRRVGVALAALPCIATDTGAMIPGFIFVHPRLTLLMGMAVMACRRTVVIAAAGSVAAGAYQRLAGRNRQRALVMRYSPVRPGRVRRLAARGGVIMAGHALGCYCRIVMA